MSVNNAFGCVAGYVLYDCGQVTGSDEQFGCIKRYFTLGGTMFMNQLDETFEYLFLAIYSFGLFLQEQVLGDGEHFERSPMYHCIMLYRVLDCYNLVRNNACLLYTSPSPRDTR